MPFVAMFTYNLSQEAKKGFMHMHVAVIRAAPHWELADDIWALSPNGITKNL
jgi:hypothetical protein